MKTHQYTIRGVPESVHRALRRRAVSAKTSLNALLLRSLEVEAGVAVGPKSNHDLDEFFGSWVKDPAVDRALRLVRRIEPGDWDE